MWDYGGSDVHARVQCPWSSPWSASAVDLPSTCLLFRLGGSDWLHLPKGVPLFIMTHAANPPRAAYQSLTSCKHATGRKRRSRGKVWQPC